jgi:sterol 3beta-glucosyltransferase
VSDEQFHPSRITRHASRLKINIIVSGTYGDIIPHIALAKGLQSAGHEVKLAGGKNFKDLVESHGISFYGTSSDYETVMKTESGREVLRKKGNITPYRLRHHILPSKFKEFVDAWIAAQWADVIIGHHMIVGLLDIAQALDVPLILSSAMPLLTPTWEFPSIPMPPVSFGRLYNRFSHVIYRFMQIITFEQRINYWRKQILYLPPRPLIREIFTAEFHDLSGKAVPILYHFSPTLLPRPSDWPDNAFLSGRLILEEGDAWEPPEDLLRFLDAGSPPLYIGFGSMTLWDPKKVTDIVLEALSITGQRAIIVKGWGGMELENNDRIYSMTYVPYDWLFKKVSAVIHHGGFGTTDSGLRAGLPTLVCPFFMDQPFWAKRVSDLGVGPRPIPQNRLNVKSLVKGIRELIENKDIRKRAVILGEKMRQEPNGVTEAVKWIEKIVLCER